MRHMMTLVAVLTMMAGIATSQTEWVVDKSHSYVKFAVSHLTIAEVDGRFKDFDVKMTHTVDDFTDAKIEATIKTTSIDTDNERRDNHLRSDDFLNSELYPEMKFVSSKVEKVGAEKYKVHGTLTIRDISKPVVLETRYAGTVTDSRGNLKSGFKATTTINRFEFGIRWNSAIEAGGFVAGKDVDITLLMEFAKKK